MLNASPTQTNLSGLASSLVNEGLLSVELAKTFDLQAKQAHMPFIRYLVSQNILSSEVLIKHCAKVYELPIFNLQTIEKNWTSLLNAELIQRYHFIPLQKEKEVFHIGLSDPTMRQVLAIVSFYTGLKPVVWLVDDNDLTRYISSATTQASKHTFEVTLLNELNNEESVFSIQDNSITYDEPVVKFVDHIIEHAIQQASSDIHIEPYEKICRIRYRKDGILYEVAEIASKMATRLITRLKVMSQLDITERRLPQDGRFQIRETDIRINTCPTLFGEKIVLRILDNKKSALDLKELGLTEFQYGFFKETIKKPQGLILVTGPTGSGKTITLYSALHALNTDDKNISTVEDPIEIKLPGINQVNINPKIKLDFATALRTFLRQDPDIIMVGEIRDAETAEIAIQAAQTGHLVLSTLHTNSALDTMTRLIMMGIPSYNLVSSITLIIAQRLIRKLCNRCKQVESLPINVVQELKLSTALIYKAVGCSYCLHGYQGRIGIYEFLPMTSEMAYSLLHNHPKQHVQHPTYPAGFISMREAGLEKVREGLTSLSEVNRVIPNA